MRAVIPVLFILAGMLFPVACTGDGPPQSRQVGGCSADTISLDIDVDTSCGSALSPVRLSLLSVERVEDETCRDAVSGLVALLDEMGIGICSVPRLIVISEGPCWPRHRIDIRLEKGSEDRFQEIKSALSGGTLAGFRPSEQRPDGYGLFFVQAGFGSTDRWTLWYGRPPR